MAVIAHLGASLMTEEVADVVFTVVILAIGYFLFCPSCLGQFFANRWQRTVDACQSETTETRELVISKKVDCAPGVASGTPQSREDALILTYESTLAGHSLLEDDVQLDEATTNEEVPRKLEVDDFLSLWRNSPAAQKANSSEEREGAQDLWTSCAWACEQETSIDDSSSFWSDSSAGATVSLDADHSLETALASGDAQHAGSTLLTGAKHCGASWAHAAVERVREQGLELEGDHAVELVRIFGSENRSDLAVDFWMEEDEDPDSDTDLYGAVLEACIRCGDYDGAAKTAQSTAWRIPIGSDGQQAMLALVRWLSRRQDFNRAWECYKNLRSAGAEANLATHRAILLASVRGNDMKLANAIFQDILASGLKADGTTLSAMICGHCATGALDKAMAHFGMMKRLGITPTASLFDSIINGCMWGNAAPAVLEQVLADMENDGVRPSNTTVAALVRHYGRGGNVDRALSIFEEMPQRHGLELDGRAYSALISVCVSNDRLDMALDSVDKMTSAGFGPSARTFESLITSCLKCGELDRAVQLVDQALGLRKAAGSAMQLRLDSQLLEDLLRMIGRRRLAARLGAPLLERLRAADVEVSEQVASSILRSAEISSHGEHPVLHQRRTERQNWRDFSRVAAIGVEASEL